MRSLPHQMNIGWRVVRTSRTVTRRLCGHVSGGPSGVFDQSNARVSAPISPPSARKSPAASPLIRVASPRRLSRSVQAGIGKAQWWAARYCEGFQVGSAVARGGVAALLQLRRRLVQPALGGVVGELRPYLSGDAGMIVVE